MIGWQLDIRIAAALAVLAMSLGTAALTSLVAISSVAARVAAFASAKADSASTISFHALQAFVGAAVLMISLSLLGVRVG